MTPVIALVGRPNVGKSTLFNRLTRSRDALVADYPGLTRDRKYGQGRMGGQEYIVVDTGGISGGEQGIDSAMARQSLQAVSEADAIVFLVDGRAGLNPADEMIADHLRRSGKPCYLVVNKTDGIDPDMAMADFFGLGLGQPLPISASQGRGVRSLIELVLEPRMPEEEQESASEPDEGEEPEENIHIAVIGRPNVGKSTLVNRMLGEERVIVYDHPGTTRDSIYIPYSRGDRHYTLIDTAGVRRRRSVNDAVEKFSIVKTLQAIKDAHVVIVVMDAREGLTDQDLHMLGFALEDGRAMVIAVNKWDGMTQEAKRAVREQVERRLIFAHFAEVHFISALHGSGVGDLYDSVEEAYRSAMGKWSTSRLTRLLQDVVADHQPPMVKGRRIKLRYAHQGGSNPPIFVVHGNQTEALPESYRRYLQNRFIEHLGISGTPVRFEFRSGENPYEGKRNQLTERQIKKKLRLKKLHKSSGKRK